ncbi:Longin-like domain-containing protein [Globomyces pollinis-pini]|nr:Longin-like domain-containing protein [Globomyces pollinis-pini]
MVQKNHINLNLISIKAVLIIDSEGKKVLSKYYCKELKDQAKLEKNLFEKTKKSSSDIILFENLIVIYKPIVDVFIYVLGGLDENEIMLSGVLLSFAEALGILLKSQIEKRTILENMDTVLLALDETIDDGVILETDASAIASRVSKQGTDSSSIPIADQTLSQVWKSAQGSIMRSFLQ